MDAPDLTTEEKTFLDGLAAGLRWSAMGDVRRAVMAAKWPEDQGRFCEDAAERAQVEDAVRDRFRYNPQPRR